MSTFSAEACQDVSIKMEVLERTLQMIKATLVTESSFRLYWKCGINRWSANGK